MYLFIGFVFRYGIVKDIADDSFVPSLNLDQCTPIHLNLVVSLCLMFLLVLLFLVVPMQIGLDI